MKQIVIMLLLVLFASPAFAEKAIVKVNGLVCDFCAQGISKNFYKHDEVEKVDVNLTTKLVKLDFKKDKTLTDDNITKIITDNGFNVVGIERQK